MCDCGEYVYEQNCLTHTPESLRNTVETCCDRQRVARHQAKSLLSSIHSSNTLSFLCCLSSVSKQQERMSRNHTEITEGNTILWIPFGLNKPGHATVPIMMSLFRNLLYPCEWTQSQLSQKAVSQKNMMNIAWFVWRSLLGGNCSSKPTNTSA